MLIKYPGRYKVRTSKGSTYAIAIVERNGELGVWLMLAYVFVRIKDFVNVEVLCCIDKHKEENKPIQGGLF